MNKIVPIVIGKKIPDDKKEEYYETKWLTGC